MARSYFVLYVCLIALSLSRTHAQNLCDDECVVEVYSTYCGGARCQNETIEGREPFLCSQQCLDALEGLPLGSCLQSSSEFAATAAQTQEAVVLEVESFCVAFELLNATASAPEPEVASADSLDEGSPAPVEAIRESIDLDEEESSEPPESEPAEEPAIIEDAFEFSPAPGPEAFGSEAELDFNDMDEEFLGFLDAF